MERRMLAGLLGPVALVSTGVLGAPAAHRVEANNAATAAVTAACERAVRSTLRDSRGAAAVASFDGPPSAQPGTAGGAETTWRGAGHVRGASDSRPIRYSCSFDTVAGEVAGVVVRDAGAPERAARARSVEPDLSRLTPAACESAAARALKQRWPGVSQISFDAGTRRLEQAADGPASLRGQGTAMPSIRDPATHFSYDCDLDPRNGRVVSLRLSD